MARYYSSAMGRFMSPDWSAKAEPVPYAKLDDPQSLNLNAYVRNNPLTRVDLDGHTDPDPNKPPTPPAQPTANPNAPRPKLGEPGGGNLIRTARIARILQRRLTTSLPISRRELLISAIIH